MNYPGTDDTEESDENNETDDEEESGENNATGKSISVYIMFALSWLVIYNIWKHQETERDEKEEGMHKSNDKLVIWFKKIKNYSNKIELSAVFLIQKHVLYF